MEIKHAIEAAHTDCASARAGLRGIYGTIFTGPPSDERADLRNVTIFADAEVDRSPCGTGTAAVMSVIDAMGLLGDDKPFVHESLIGTRFSGRVALADRRSAITRRSCRRSKGRRGSPASTRSSSMTPIR